MSARNKEINPLFILWTMDFLFGGFTDLLLRNSYKNSSTDVDCSKHRRIERSCTADVSASVFQPIFHPPYFEESGTRLVSLCMTIICLGSGSSLHIHHSPAGSALFNRCQHGR